MNLTTTKVSDVKSLRMRISHTAGVCITIVCNHPPSSYSRKLQGGPAFCIGMHNPPNPSSEGSKISEKNTQQKQQQQKILTVAR